MPPGLVSEIVVPGEVVGGELVVAGAGDEVLVGGEVLAEASSCRRA